MCGKLLNTQKSLGAIINPQRFILFNELLECVLFTPHVVQKCFPGNLEITSKIILPYLKVSSIFYNFHSNIISYLSMWQLSARGSIVLLLVVLCKKNHDEEKESSFLNNFFSGFLPSSWNELPREEWSNRPIWEVKISILGVVKPHSVQALSSSITLIS